MAGVAGEEDQAQSPREPSPSPEYAVHSPGVPSQSPQGEPKHQGARVWQLKEENAALRTQVAKLEAEMRDGKQRFDSVEGSVARMDRQSVWLADNCMYSSPPHGETSSPPRTREGSMPHASTGSPLHEPAASPPLPAPHAH